MIVFGSKSSAVCDTMHGLVSTHFTTHLFYIREYQLLQGLGI